MNSINKALDELHSEVLIRQEKEIIEQKEKAGAIRAMGLTSALEAMQAAVIVSPNSTKLLIANGTTAAAVKKATADRDDIEIIVSKAVDAETVYQVVDEKFRRELLEMIGKGRKV